MEGKTHTLYKNGVVPSKSPTEKVAPSSNPSDCKVAPSRYPSRRFAPSKSPTEKVAPSSNPSGSKVAPSKSPRGKFAPSKSPRGKFAPSSNPSDISKKTQGYNIVKINMGGKTNVIQDNNKELDITIPKLVEKKHGMKLRNRNGIDYDKLANPKVNKLIQLPEKPHTPEHVEEALSSNIRSH